MRVDSSKLSLLLIGGSALALLTGLSLQTQWPDWRWHQEPVHSTMEALGGLASIATAVVLLHRQQTFTVLKWRALAVGLLGMGLLQIFHAMAQPGHAFVFLRDVASLTGSIGFVLTWWLDEPDHPSRTARWLWMIPAGAFALGAWGLLFPEQLPEMMRNGQWTAPALVSQSLASLFFFAGAVRLFPVYRRSVQAEDLLFTFLPLLFAFIGFDLGVLVGRWLTGDIGLIPIILGLVAAAIFAGASYFLEPYRRILLGWSSGALVGLSIAAGLGLDGWFAGLSNLLLIIAGGLIGGRGNVTGGGQVVGRPGG